jgi:N-carbamoyl-L-amino-acid hydrolase
MSMIGDKARMVAARVDGARQWHLLMAIAQYGARGDGGVDRPALSAHDVAARNHLVDWATARGLSAYQDEAANLFIRLEGRNPDLPPLLMGSHLDSQPTGGKFDGAYGVIAGCEVLAAFQDAGIVPERPLEAVSWTNEEGSRFLPGATGSSAFAGTRQLADMRAKQTVDGRNVGEEIDAVIAATRAQHRSLADASAFAHLEAHIEQGPILEREKTRIGIVEGIQGVMRLRITIAGEAAHAGTTPHALRKDAVVAMARIIAALDPLTRQDEDILRLTFGRIEVQPNVPNTVPESAVVTIDLRHPSGAEIERVFALIEAAARDHAAPCTAQVERISMVDPVAFPEAVLATIEAAAASLGEDARRMVSGAGHDSLHLARVCPTGMVFVPCERGVSHNPAEAASPDDLAAGTRVLAAAAAALLETPPA